MGIAYSSSLMRDLHAVVLSCTHRFGVPETPETPETPDGGPGGDAGRAADGGAEEPVPPAWIVERTSARFVYMALAYLSEHVIEWDDDDVAPCIRPRGGAAGWQQGGADRTWATCHRVVTARLATTEVWDITTPLNEALTSCHASALARLREAARDTPGELKPPVSPLEVQQSMSYSLAVTVVSALLRDLMNNQAPVFLGKAGISAVENAMTTALLKGVGGMATVMGSSGAAKMGAATMRVLFAPAASRRALLQRLLPHMHAKMRDAVLRQIAGRVVAGVERGADGKSPLPFVPGRAERAMMGVAAITVPVGDASFELQIEPYLSAVNPDPETARERLQDMVMAALVDPYERGGPVVRRPNLHAARLSQQIVAHL